ncbi:hypothetical protein C8Q74DRAFT_394876 [Fomes fomentarius]|nr:hypothetical protein C8Q74DRAFT_394876 [Fomes fomentarius]
MDPIAMVRHLIDVVALAEAEALKPKSYLLYVDRKTPTSASPPTCASSSSPTRCTPQVVRQYIWSRIFHFQTASATIGCGRIWIFACTRGRSALMSISVWLPGTSKFQMLSDFGRDANCMSKMKRAVLAGEDPDAVSMRSPTPASWHSGELFASRDAVRRHMTRIVLSRSTITATYIEYDENLPNQDDMFPVYSGASSNTVEEMMRANMFKTRTRTWSCCPSSTSALNLEMTSKQRRYYASLSCTRSAMKSLGMLHWRLFADLWCPG